MHGPSMDKAFSGVVTLALIGVGAICLAILAAFVGVGYLLVRWLW